MNIGIFSDSYLPARNGVARGIYHLKTGLELRGHKVVLVTISGPSRFGRHGGPSLPGCSDRHGSHGRTPRLDYPDSPEFERPGFPELPDGPVWPARPDYPDSPGFPELPDGTGDSPRIRRIHSLPVKPSLDLRVALTSPAAMGRIIREEELEIIHTHTEFSIGLAARAAAMHANLPMIHTFHTLYEHYRHFLPLGKWLPSECIRRRTAWFLKPYQAVVCPSLKSQNYLRSFVPGDTTVYIPNGITVPPEDTPPAAAPALSIPAVEGRPPDNQPKDINPREKIILYVGRLSPEKRSLQLVSQMLPLLRLRPDLKLILVGDGPLRHAVKRKIKEAGLEKSVLCTCFISPEKVQELYRRADLFITASLSENHPYTILEACVAGLPFVVRDDPAFYGLVENGKNGFTAATDAQMPAAVLKLLGDTRLRHKFGACSRSIANRYDRDKYITMIVNLYRQCLKHTGKE